MADLDPEYKPPNTFITWYAQEARKNAHVDKAISSEILTSVLMSVNFAVVHNAAIIGTHAILSIIGADPEQRVVKVLRDEIESALQNANGCWSEDTLANMRHLDSALYEALRLHGVDSLSLRRLVMTDLVTDDGINLEKGTSIAVSSYAVHRDHANYSDPDTFNPFRFSRSMADETRSNEKDASLINQLDPTVAESSSASTSDSYLTFGHGRHVSADMSRPMVCFHAA